MRLYITALNPTDSVTLGFWPAARALGHPVTVLTDQPAAHEGLYGPAEVLPCEVRDFRAVIDTISRHDRPVAIFSNSDHLQAPTALAATYFGLPAKDWRAALNCKNKALMRSTLAAAGVERVHSARLRPPPRPPGPAPHPVRPEPGEPAAGAVRPGPGAHAVRHEPGGDAGDGGPGRAGDGNVPADDDLGYGGPYPAVVKPREGVASEDVVLVRDAAELRAAAGAIAARRPADPLVAEEYLPGELRTLETLGDGERLHVLGGFRTTLGAPPHFVEERLDWDPGEPAKREHVLAALRALGVGLGACHTEYVTTPAGPRIIEVNYRVIGDNCDLLLAEFLGIPLFELILRLHLGEPLPAGLPRPGEVKGAAAAVSVVADRAGTIVSAPPAADPLPGEEVRLWHRPLRSPGDRVEPAGTNRDYLAVIRAIAPDPQTLDHAVNARLAADPWVIA
ncbi:ATP-grasp domain-containing protein [Bailinhaonella thermotolerans]|uniref:ATP-grasp domain-containing protein n=1 Tax=Bailinhaonella thermotolerans TaxID=1070861 RepID=UPI000E76CABD|nr:siderophore biosynthesis protein [Bailinhaonella thermotolerans]